MQYLDKEGLEYYNQKIQAKLNNKANADTIMSNAVVTRDSWTDSAWNTYGEIGHLEIWNGTESQAKTVAQGALFCIIGTSTDTKRQHILIYKRTDARSTLYGECIGHFNLNNTNYSAGTGISISNTGTISSAINNATTKANGLMSSTDKTKLDSINVKKTYEVIIDATWTGDIAPYTKTIAVAGIKSTDVVYMYPVWSDDLTTRTAEKAEYNKIDMISSNDGNITLTCDEEKPTIALNIRLEV